MTTPHPSFTEAELLAYAENRTNPTRSAQIEGFLAANPDLAAQVMRLRHESARWKAAGGAKRGRSLSLRTPQLLFACIICAVAGWALAEGLDDDGPFRDLSLVPEYVDDAVQSLHATNVRDAMASQPAVPVLDSEEIEKVTRIRLPAFPGEWKLLDAQVFPSEEGPSVNVVLLTAPGRKLNLFAVRANTLAGGTPAVTSEKGSYAAYWETGGVGYVLTSLGGSAAEMLAHAKQLAGSVMPQPWK